VTQVLNMSFKASDDSPERLRGVDFAQSPLAQALSLQSSMRDEDDPSTPKSSPELMQRSTMSPQSFAKTFAAHGSRSVQLEQLRMQQEQPQPQPVSMTPLALPPTALPPPSPPTPSRLWLNPRTLGVLRLAVFVACFINVIIFPAQLAFSGPILFSDQPGWASIYTVLDIVLWAEMGSRFATPAYHLGEPVRSHRIVARWYVFGLADGLALDFLVRFPWGLLLTTHCLPLTMSTYYYCLLRTAYL
jgi:hypothetical protein